MKRITKTLFLLCSALLLFASWNAQADDSRAMAAMKQDYPGLMSLYGDRIAGQKAHYIFVVDCKKQVFDQQFSEKLDSADFGKLVLHIVIDKAVMRQRAAHHCLALKVYGLTSIFRPEVLARQLSQGYQVLSAIPDMSMDWSD